MPQHLHLDFETFSKKDPNKVGSYRYIFDRSAEILVMAMALDDEEPAVWSQLDDGGSKMDRYWDALEDPNVLIYAFSAQFEMAVCQALLWKTIGVKCPDLRRFRCVQSFARRAALPGSLEKLGEVLELGNQKDKRGKALIKKFSMMQPARKPSKKNPNGLPPHRIRPEHDPAAFAEFCAYCAQDVRAEQEVARRLSYFDEPINNANYSLDAIINARGVTVNLQALRHAQKLIEEETEIVSEKFFKLCGFSVTQNAKLLEWLGSVGTPLPNLQAETIEEFLANKDYDTGLGCQALRLKQSIAYASIKKVATMLACAGPHDNRIRGMLNHHGATTGRWTASLVQFQNMKRPADHMAQETYKDSGRTWSEMAYREICEGVSREMLELCYGPVLEVISSCIRHFVHDSDE